MRTISLFRRHLPPRASHHIAAGGHLQGFGVSRSGSFIHLLAYLAIILIGAEEAVLSASPPVAHAWKTIEYPRVLPSDSEKESMTVLVGSGGGIEESHLRLDALWGPRNRFRPPEFGAPEIEVKLHLADGKVIPPQRRERSQHGFLFIFPWQRNALEEAWFEMKLRGQAYWIELPYGFTRNPSDPLPTDPALGEPVFPPAMKKLGENDRLVPWRHVNYDLGQIQNGWRLFLKLANPFDARAETILYRDDTQVGKSMFLWQIDTPKTALAIKSKSRVLQAYIMGIRLHEDGMRRSDDYRFNRFPVTGRDWGTVVLKVGDQAYECVVPSSLFNYVHGVTDPGNPHRLLLERPQDP